MSQIFAVLGGFALFLFVVLFVSRACQVRLTEDERFSVPFTEIDCNSPVGSDRITFLTQVLYLSEYPPRISLIDPELTEKLTEAFLKHPHVERLESVTVTPEKHLILKLQFRSN